ncbi:hypothetical protein GJV85_08040 [Sulfurimonas aquatica]|uniref:Periplasmic protein n=1 Tax=Sulfurimonas aquatica TaxID=2672570 RepID=A0A975B0N4_9BACT|nr:hypothetical protein [Sulfurimonas aquatica]QSZ42061.1 hypothetical protein GJV85_08040 [Sulfurimonas aquatica]
MQKILKWLTPIIALGVAVFIIFFLISINSQDVFLESEPLVLEHKTDEKIPEKNWLDKFSKSQRLGYFYPVNEVYVKVDLKEKITKTITYQLSAKILDPYQLFCLKEELKRHKLKYYLKKDKINVDLFIYSQNVDKLQNLVKELKNYEISANIKPYKEDY